MPTVAIITSFAHQPSYTINIDTIIVHFRNPNNCRCCTHQIGGKYYYSDMVLITCTIKSLIMVFNIIDIIEY